MGLKITNLGSRQAARKPRLSLCMIVRNEEEDLPRCLESVKGVADEIIIVDTGSTDATVEVAKAYGATVLHEEWTEDFARHRNTSLAAANGDWILYLDADEELVNGTLLLSEIDNPAMDGYMLTEINFLGSEPGIDWVTNAAFRLFRNRPEYRFSGALHEQILTTALAHGATVGESRVEINHYGYLNNAVVSKDKKTRNREIVLRQLEDAPNDPHILFNAGVEFQRIGDYATALDYFAQAFSNITEMGTMYASLLFRNLVNSFAQIKRYDEALEVAAGGLEVFPDYADLHLLAGQIHRVRGEYREAISSYQQATDIGEKTSLGLVVQSGTGSFHAWHELGQVHERLGDMRKAVDCYGRAVNTAKGVFAPPLASLARILSERQDLDEAVANLRAVIVAPGVSDKLRVVGETLASRGHFSHALTLVDQALDETPTNHAARIVRAYCLVGLGRYDDARSTLDAVSVESESYNAARVQKVLVGIVQDDQAFVHGIADEAVEAGLDDLARASKIAASARRGEPFEVAPNTVIEAVLTDLAIALVRLGALEAFNAVLPAVYAASEDVARLDEVIGMVLFEADFPDAAGDRLVRALETGRKLAPASLDALAKICQAKGMDEDAEGLMTMALNADPEDLPRYTALASLMVQQGRYADAAAVVARGLEIWPRATVLRELHESFVMIAASRGGDA